VVLAPVWLALVVLPALAVNAVTLGLALVVVGAVNGALDVSMNAQGLSVERRSPRPIFASLHAAFSFGALGGASLGAVAAAAGIAPLPHLATMALVGALAAAVVVPSLVDDRADAADDAPRFARPSRRLALVGAVAFCAVLAEGAVFDWSGVYMVRVTGAAAGIAPLALAAFAAGMGIGRLAGDPLTARLGPAPLGRACAGLAAAGLAVALAFADPAPAVLGFAAMGLGLSSVFPLALRASSPRGAADGAALAAVSTLGYAGLLTGPPVIGLLADGVGLRAALGLVVALCVLAAALAGAMRGSAVRTASG
jgi:fucose permease